MPLSVSDYIATQIPADYRERVLTLAQSGTDPVTGKAYALPTRTWQPGDPTRTEIVTLAETFANYWGVASTIDGTGNAVGQDGIVVTFASGGLLRFAGSITPDPSLPNPDGTYPLAGNGFLDAVASDLYNVLREGVADPNSPINNGGPMVESNAALTARCFAKLDPQGLLFEDGTDPYIYFATTGYAGAPLSFPVTRGQVSIDLSTVTVTLYLANAGGGLPAPDQQAENDWLQVGVPAVPTGIVLIVLPATPSLISISLEVWAPATVGDVQTNIDVTSAIESYFAQLPIGGAPGAVPGPKGVVLSALEAWIFEHVPYVEDIENLLLNGSAADVTLTTGQVAVPFPPVILVHLT